MMVPFNNAAAFRGRKRTGSEIAGDATKRSTPAMRLEEAEKRVVAAEAAEKRRQTTGHKFRLGQRVTLVGRSLDGRISDHDFEISKLLPAEIWDGSNRQYRIKGMTSGQERVVKESELAGGVS